MNFPMVCAFESIYIWKFYDLDILELFLRGWLCSLVITRVSFHSFELGITCES